MIGLKYPLRNLGISKLEQGPANLVFSFVENSPVDPALVLEFIAAQKAEKAKKKRKAGAGRPVDPVRLTPDQRLIVALDEKENLFNRIDTVLQSLKSE
jgi:hypothetical protein